MAQTTANHPPSIDNTADDIAITDEMTNETSTQYVTFKIADEDFGFPMSQVNEIIRLPMTVGVPLTPPALLGLSNLRGNVLPILDLRYILHFTQQKNNDATRVIVADAGCQIGLVVDKVSRVINVEKSEVEGVSAEEPSTNANLLTGVIRNKKKLIQLLDVGKLIKQDFERVLPKQLEQGAEKIITTNISPSIDDSLNKDAGQLVSFSVDAQEYAFDLMDVEEIVRVPDEIAQVPASEQQVLGLIDLRGRLLQLVSLRRLFSMPEKVLDEYNRILVISVTNAVGGVRSSVGLVVDDVREVLSVDDSMRDAVPTFLGNNKENEIIAICRLEEGKRLVSILSAEKMFQHPAIQSAMTDNNNNIQGNKVNSEDFDNTEVVEDDDTQMVVFKLAEQEYGITIEDVQEITRVPDEMSKVPQTDAFIEGMVNLRGTVLPVLDMRGRFGLERMERNERQRILVLNLKGNRTGFIMDSVVEVLRLNRNSIEQAPNLSEDQARVMGRVVNLKESKRMIQVLNVHELLSDTEEEALQEIKL